jgi:Na+/phosphate symporter
VNLLFNVLPSLVLYLFIPQSAKFLQRFWPETTEETISKPKYIQGNMIKDPTGSIELIHLEQNRLLEIASSSFNTIREDAQASQGKAFHEAFTALSLSINETIKELTSKENHSSVEYSKRNQILNNQHLLENVNTSLETFGTEVASIKVHDQGAQFSNTVVEGLDTILLTLMDVAKDKDEFDMDFLAKMTSSEGNGISKIRSAYLNEERDFDTQGKMSLLSATNLTERLIHDFGEIGNNYKNIEAIA